MVAQARPLKTFNEREHAIYFYSRERRLSLEGVPKLFRTHRFFDEAGGQMALAPIPTTTVFPSRSAPVTFKTAVRIADNVDPRAGLIFEFGGNLRMVALWLDNQTLGFRAGGSVAGEFSSVVYDNGEQWPAGLELDIVAGVRPNSGQIQVWLNGLSIIKSSAASGNFNGEWAGTGDGAFATAAQGALPSDVTQSGAPTNFEVVEPLSVYLRQFPRHMVTPP